MAESFNWNDLAKRAGQIQEVMAEADPVALKNAYRQLFDRIVIGDLNDQGERSIEFFIRGTYPGTGCVIAADTKPVTEREWGG